MDYCISRFFPNVDAVKLEKLEAFSVELAQWNEKINLVSRRDVDNLMVAHILHSLSIAKFLQFTPGSRVMDLGCGGGLPGLPLAIFFPEVRFHLIDRIGKKVRAAQEMVDTLRLSNVTTQHGDSGECKERFDFVVSRAVMSQTDLVKAVRKNISPAQRNAMPNGLISLKGGDLTSELSSVHEPTEVVDIYNWFPLEFFKTKKLVYTILS